MQSPATAAALLLGAAGVCLGGEAHPVAALADAVCRDCHAGPDPAGGFDLTGLNPADPAADAAAWEAVVRKLRTKQMPPAAAFFENDALRDAALARLSADLDAASDAAPDPGRTASLRRLTRFEYENSVRDLLGLTVDAAEWLPKDPSSGGFDNVTVGDLSPTRMERLVTAARRIARRALGRPGRGPAGRTVRLPPDRTQEGHVAGLPPGTRGGVLIDHHFPRSGRYEVRVRLMRDRNEHVEGLSGPHTLDVLLDGAPAERFTVRPPAARKKDGPKQRGDWSQPTHADVDRHLAAVLTVPAGPHAVGVTFLQTDSSLIETARRPHRARFNYYRHPRRTPAVYEVTITGPLGDPTADSAPGSSEPRERVLTCLPAAEDDFYACAEAVLRPLLRRAYRRPATDADLAGPLALFRDGSAGDGPLQERFEAGVELALAGVLVNPNFLFRVERDPPALPPGTAYAVGDLALASRLSFFLWGGPPDDALLALAERGELSEPEALDRQTRRMLADPRAAALTTNFAGQWLHLRNLDGATPDMRRFPDFDDNLRAAFREETQRLFAEVISENRPVAALIRPGHAWLNERLAAHYGVPHVRGSHFRKVDLGENPPRGGLLRHGSLLTVTSLPTRTSPVLRGAWVLGNLLGTPPPPPPDDIPALADNTVAAGLSVRDRLAAHRADAACASCHDLIDPLGFAFERYDAVGRFRTHEDEAPVNPAGATPAGTPLDGLADLEDALLADPEPLVHTLAEKLLTYALGRPLTHHDAPAVRRAVREAGEDGFRSHALIAAVVRSRPFTHRRTAAPAAVSTPQAAR